MTSLFRVGPNGTDRVKSIKSACKLIIENLVPDALQLLLFTFKDGMKATEKDFAKMSKCTKYRYEEYL